ncbi:MAG: hypothetical protein ACD_27C00032G0009 [uncultured bacterium]|nr:MAG: hypothetical protein ACD_27C00032G0009 [uncultured bacterium]
MIWALLGLVLAFFFPITIQASESQPAIVVVSQVRGSECCEPGDFSFFERQLAVSQETRIPIYFALRFDALHDTDIITSLRAAQNTYPNLIRPAAFLEITPSLAHRASVLYTAPERDWYKTTYVYPAGYMLAERKALLDTYMAQYHTVFGYYPSLTVGWFVDTYSLNYLHDRYGVSVHELTREQWGTDSYTLSGGPIHYPYEASRQWAFLPGLSGLTIIRQTIEDPLKNYGDMSSSYTSQPNDYGQHTDFAYFQSLLNTALRQPGGQPGFAVLGLETSMPDTYQTEFAHQLRYIASEFPNAIYPDPAKLSDLSHSYPVTVYAGQGAYWITTPSYRLRLLFSQDSVSLTDLRLYHADITDPYKDAEVINAGFYIAPFLLDGSRWYQLKGNWWSRLFQPQYSQGYRTSNEQEVLPTYLAFPKRDSSQEPKVTTASNLVTLSYQTAGRGEITFEFYPEQFILRGLSPSSLRYIDHTGGRIPITETKDSQSYSLSFVPAGDLKYALKGECQTRVCTFTPHLDAKKFEQMRTKFPFLFLPSSIDDRDTNGSLIYPSLTHLIFSRTPARIVVIPRNTAGLPVNLSTPVQFEAGELSLLSDPLALQSHETQFFDFAAPAPGRYPLKIMVPGLSPRTFTFVFAPDCQSAWTKCFSHPVQLFDYVAAVLASKWQSLKH